MKKINNLESKITNVQTLSKQVFTKDPIKLNKKKSIQNATSFTKKVREHTLELLTVKFDLEKTMA